MKDPDIRAVTIPWLRATRPGALVVQEWGVDGCWVDLGSIHETCIEAFEIKSASDSPARLKTQALVYGRVFERCNVITAPNHLRRVTQLLPAWWGILRIKAGALSEERPAQNNPSPCLPALLWKSELTKLVAAHGLGRAALECQRAIDRSYGYEWTRQPQKGGLVEAVRALPPETIRAAVVAALRARKGWRLEDGRSVLGAKLRERRAVK